MTMRVLEIAFMGMGATACIDLWSLLLKTAFGIRSLDYRMLGRWILHMPSGRLVHDGIAASAPKPYERLVGWLAHYSIGVGFAFAFASIVGSAWLDRPTLLPALAFGIATVAVPFFTLQPAIGLGIASSRAKNPSAARLKSLTTHAVFGIGLHLTAYLIAR